MKHRRARGGSHKRRRGKGFGDFIGDSIGGIGTGIGKGVHNLFTNLFTGSGRRRRRGGADATEATPAPSAFSRIHKVAKDSQILSRALNEFGNPYGVGEIATKLGYGRRRHHRRGGAAYVRF